MTTSNFHVVELTLLRPFLDPTGPAEFGYLTTPSLALLQIETGISSSTVLYASDGGYRTRATDSMGVRAYPPTVVDAFSIDTSANLDPTQSAVGASWGTVTLANIDGIYDAYLPGSGYSADGQKIRILRGVKTFDDTRAIWVDPAYSTLQLLFAGVMGPWTARPNAVDISIRDASYYLERQVPRVLYEGTGGYEGGSGLTGVAKPIGIGGYPVTGGYIQNVSPTQVDGPNLIYQLNAGAIAGVGAVYDGGLPFTFGGNVSDLYSGITLPSQYRVDIGRGLFQLGTAPTYNVTADFALQPDATTLPVAIELSTILTGILGVPSELVSTDPVVASAINVVAANSTARAHVAANTGFPIGLFLASDDQPDGVTLASRILSPAAAVLVGGRDGLLKVFVPSAVPIGTTPVLTFDDTTIVTIETEALPAVINPPPWRIRVAYDRNWTIQSSGFAGAIDQTRKAYLAAPSRTADAGTVIPVPRATDPAPLGSAGGMLATAADKAAATALAADQIALWGTNLRLYNLTVPASVGIGLEWADPVKVVSKFDGLQAGKLGQIVGWGYHSTSSTTSFRVLVG